MIKMRNFCAAFAILLLTTVLCSCKDNAVSPSLTLPTTVKANMQSAPNEKFIETVYYNGISQHPHPWGKIAIDIDFKQGTLFAEENADCKFAIYLYIEKINGSSYENITDEVIANFKSIGLELTPLTSEESTAFFHIKNPMNCYKAEFTRAQLKILSKNNLGYAVFVYGCAKA